ncbi:MAG: PAS domain S-box protein [Woeseiaceae bacterium]
MSTDPLSTADNMIPSEQVRELATLLPGATTDELLHKLLANLAAVLDARRAYVTEAIGKERARTVASWEDNQRGPVREYTVTGTPCAAVMRDGVKVVDCELGARYVLDASSLGYGCESFIGSPVVDRHGTRIGQLCVFGARRLEDTEMASALVSLAAVRVSAELEHRQHEASLRRQRQQLEMLLGNLPGMVYSCDYDKGRRFRFASQGCEALTGYAVEKLSSLGRVWNAVVVAEDRERAWDEIRKAVSSQRSYEIQYRIRTQDGTERWVWDRGCGLSDDTGQIRTLEGFITDATALKESQTALASSEAYSKAIVATAAEGIITIDAQGRIGSFNRAAEEMFGYTAEELYGREVHVLMPEPHRRQHADYVEQYMATGHGHVIGKGGREVDARRKDGSVFPVYLAVSEISLAGERCFAGIIRDISDQRAAENSLIAVEQRFRAVFDQRLQLAGILSVEGVVLEANQMSLDFAGIERAAVYGRQYWKTPWWEHSPELQLRLESAIKAAADGASSRFEATCYRPDGQLATLDFSVRPIKNKSGEIIFLVTESHDITEQKYAEQEARDHRDRIAHVSRLSTLGEMAAGIAHEINQPLTAISLFSQAARRLVDAGNFEKMDEVCKKLNEHALRASDVVERMQAMAGQGASVKDVVDCNELIETAVRLAESDARIRDIRIDFERGADLPLVSVDSVQIQQVALNLMRNGMEAMLSVDCCQQKCINVRTRALENDQIEVAVIDCGNGVSESNVERLFTPFSTTKEAGMGMGLSISQAIVRAHGGRIDFHNNDTRGATFWFTLPVADRESQDGQ